MSSFAFQIPKAELHLHIEGTLEPELMFKIAQRNGIKIKYESVEALKEAYNFHNLQSFLDIYYEGANVLIHEQDFYEMTKVYLDKAASQGLVYAEIFFDPQTHTDRGIAFETVINGLTKALEESTVTSKLIMCFLRHLDAESAMRTLEMALPHKDKIIAVGLDSGEVGNPPSKFKEVFERAIEEEFLTVAHAGEEGPPEYIWEALDLLKVKRIDHGIRCIEDQKLVKRLAEEQIPLTVCPLSNVKLAVFEKLKDHNLKNLIDQGLLITINSDDPAYFGGYIGDNYAECEKELGITKDGLYSLAKNSFEASFLTPEEKSKMIELLDQFMTSI